MRALRRRRGHRASFAEQMAAAARQLRFPRAVRIAPSDPPLGCDALVDALGAGPGRNGQIPHVPRDQQDERRIAVDHEAPEVRGAGDDALLDDSALASLATGLWRARRRTLAPGTDEPRAEMRPVFRHLQSMWDTLAAAGVAIQDHDGQPFESGLALEVLTFQPTPGLRGEAVVETVRPSVYARDRVVQRGQVIVGTPEEEGDRR